MESKKEIVVSEISITLQDREELLKIYPDLQYFNYDHLPMFLQNLSKPICDIAWQYAKFHPYCQQVAIGLQKLLEAKDCLVRAGVRPTGTTVQRPVDSNQ